MTSFSLLRLAIALCLLAPACSPELQAETPDTTTQEEPMTINITAGGKTFTATIEATETGKAFVAKLPLTLDMSELNGNEKYCYGVTLPRADKYFSTIAAGDLML